MKVALFCHFYPPAPCGGAGIYAAQLAASLREAGREVAVLCAGEWQRGPKNYNGFTEERCEGVSVRHLHLNWKKAPRPFDALYDNPVLARPIQAFLAERRPNVVHVISAYTLSAQAVSAAKRLGFPVVVHLVDMWHICLRHTLLRKNGKQCSGAQEDWDCQRCLLWGTQALGLASAVLDDHRQAKLFRALAKVDAATRMPGFIGMLGNAGEARRVALRALMDADAVVAPSQTVRRIHEQNGFPIGRIRYIPHGLDTRWVRDIERRPDEMVRFAFLGNLMPIKGAHVFLEAVEVLRTPERGSFDVYGYQAGDHVYARALRERSSHRVRWHGAYVRADLPRIFSAVDVVVFPSIWRENCPLVIQESFAAGCPVITSDGGGAAETVRDEVDGLHFRTGDAADLARQMQRVIDSPGLLAQLRANVPSIRSPEAELTEILSVYGEAIAARQVALTRETLV